jgi:hypothetical protein
MFNDYPKYRMKILLFANLRTEGRKLDDLLSSPITKFVIRLRFDEKGRTFGTHWTEEKCLGCLVRRPVGKTLLALYCTVLLYR